ncbi:MAG: hypothetical protein HY901_05775 [Deltaproteobacteria bacterium]|nr:hypothetical protein [Deltaproteobacteria bacterium]
MRTVVFVASLCLAVPLVPAPAPAADEQVTRKKVQAYLDLAADLFKARDFEGALAELRRAEALSDLAMVRFNSARCLEELHREVETVTAFEKYLSLKDSGGGAAERQRRAREAIARLAPTLFGGLEVTCPLEGSSVFVMELMQAPVACPWKSDKVSAGSYEVQTFTPGFAPFITRVTVPPGKSVIVAAQAVPAPPIAAAPAPPEGASEPAPSSSQPPPLAAPDAGREQQAAEPKPTGSPSVSEGGYDVSVF